MKILLVNPCFKRKIGDADKLSPVLPPMGIAYLAAVLRKEGYGVRILDLNALGFNDEQMIKYIEDYSPDVVGLTAVTTTIHKAWNVLEMVKRKDPKIVTIIGGPHPTCLPEESVKKEFVDFVVVGEGERTIAEFVKELSKKSKVDFKKIEGLVFKEKGRIIKNKQRKNIEDLDSLPFPAIDLLPLDKYRSTDSKHKKFMPILTSRGCPGVCIFCNKLIFGYCCKMRSAKNIIEEISRLYKIGYQDFHILDDLFTNDRKRVVEFCNLLIQNNIKINWKCANGVRVNTVDLELLKLMKKTGCYMLNYGVESGNQEVLNKIKKGQTLSQIETAVRLTKKVGINCGCCFIIGNLGDNEKTMQETIDFAKKLNPDIAMFSILIPYPGTPIREIIEKEGKIFVSNWDEYDNFGGKAIFEHQNNKRELMEKMYKRAYRQFYFRPEYIIRQIFKRRTLNEFISRAKAFTSLFKI